METPRPVPPACGVSTVEPGKLSLPSFLYGNPWFNLEAWDASDMFLVWPLPRFAMVTGRLRELILREKFTGVSVEPLSAMRTNSLVPTLTPGHVQDWFDEPRASKLAEETEQVLQSSEYRS
jgi:hypothetical protein